MKPVSKRTRLLRYFLSCATSALLWLPVPFLVEYFDPSKTERGRQLILERLPTTMPLTFVGFFIVALIMHRIFAAGVVRLRWFEFCLVPIVTLPAAAILVDILFCLTSLVTSLSSGAPSLIELIAGPIFFIFTAILMVTIQFLWISYPLALVNEFLIRCFLGKALSTESSADA